MKRNIIIFLKRKKFIQLIIIMKKRNIYMVKIKMKIIQIIEKLLAMAQWKKIFYVLIFLLKIIIKENYMMMKINLLRQKYLKRKIY